MTSAVTAASSARATLTQHRSAELDLTRTEYRGLRELHITVRPLPGETPADTVRRLAAVLKENDAAVVRQEFFGSLAAHGEVMQTMQRELGAVDWPVTYVQGGSCGPGPLAGTHVLAVAGAPVETIAFGGRPIGRSFSDKWVRHVLLSDVRSTDTSLPKPDQARQTFENMEAVLQQAGMTFANVARTWLFLDDILSWYGPLNTVRTDFYRPRGVFDRMVPASTGVSGCNPAGAALAAGTWAAEPLNGAFTMREVTSPKQCEATCYGSSFSRAVELGTPALCRVMVSGTASIEPGGQSVCGGDVEAQIDLTMEVIRAILVSRGLDFADGSRVTAYFKRPQDVRFFDAWRKGYGLENWPVINTVADICRDELLFELEMDALAPASPKT
ncbi:MAG: endoribonuclease L-PSP [Verrucomicrobia bacterium]|nr:endoribonuclease L-PSP [Verrucomicrobiota bacterium]